MTELALFLALAIITEQLTEYFKPVLDKYIPPVVLSGVFGVALALTVQADVFTPIGFAPLNKWLAYIFTGLLASGGSKIAHELIAKLRASRDDINNIID